MDKYISQTALIDKLNNAIMLQKVIARNLDVKDDPVVQMELKAYTDILNGIKDEPAADVVEVVRCRECAYCPHEDEHEHWCMGFRPGRLVTQDDYCSHGTRKETSA